MKKICEYCGKDLKKDADVCLHCGKIIKKEEIKSEKVIKNKEIKKEKIPGNGKSIAGMVLGIVSSTWTLFELMSISIVSLVLNEILYYESYYTSPAAIKIGFAVGYTMLSLIPSLVGLPLSIAGYKSKKTGKNIAGLILNIVGLSISLIIYVYIMLFA